MAKAAPVQAIPFTNDLGHVINPGDQVVIISSCYRSTAMRTGTYLGKRIGNEIMEYDRATQQYKATGKFYETVVVEAEEFQKKLVHNVTGAEYDYSKTPNVGVPHPGPAPHFDRYSTGRYVTPTAEQESAWQQAYVAWRVKEEAYRNAREEWMDANYHWIEVPFKRKSSLQLNRIFPLNIDIKQLTKAKF